MKSIDSTAYRKKGWNMVKLYYGDTKVCEVLTNCTMNVNKILSISGINMDEWSREHGIDDWKVDNLKIIKD